MNRPNPAVALAVAFALCVGLGGCKDDSKDSKAKEKPAAKVAPDSGDKARIAELEGKLRAADEEAARSAEQVGQITKERDAAVAKAKEAQGPMDNLWSQLQAERKATVAVEEKLKSLQTTLNTLRRRLWASGQSDWVVRVQAEAFESQKDVQVLANAQAGGGKLLRFDKPTSAAETVVTVSPGTYKVVPVGMAPEGGDHDALDLTVKALEPETGAIDLRQRIFFDQEWDKIMDASGAPSIVVAREGKLKVSLQVDEETGALLDQVEIRVDVPK